MQDTQVDSHQSKIYHELSEFYERIFAPFLHRRIQWTIQSLEIPPGAKILDVGVGTGLSLSAYPRHAEVTGIDIASGMLAQAQKKIDRPGWRHVELRRMNALDMDFPDESFDYVMAFHIVSVVPDYRRLVREIVRVSKPGATIVIINHFRSQRKWLAPLVDLLDPVTRRLGWRTTLRFSDVLDNTPLRVQRRFKTHSRSLFTIVVATKPGPNAAVAPSRRRPPFGTPRPRPR